MSTDLTWDNGIPVERHPITAYTGFGFHSMFTIKALAGGAAYELTSPFPGQQRTFHDTDPETLKEIAQRIYDELLQQARVVLSDDQAMRCIDNVTEFTFPDAVRTHSCVGPCGPRQDHRYTPEPLIARRIEGGRWVVSRPGGLHATADQEWKLPANCGPYEQEFLHDRDEALELVSLLPKTTSCPASQRIAFDLLELRHQHISGADPTPCWSDPSFRQARRSPTAPLRGLPKTKGMPPMAKISDVLKTTQLRRNRYRTEFPGFGIFFGNTSTLAQEAAVAAFQEFHQQHDDRKRAFITCPDGVTLLHCFAVPNGWAYQVVHLDKPDTVHKVARRAGQATVYKRTGECQTWEGFLASCAEVAAGYCRPPANTVSPEM
ncbi:hypothetical protein GCM10022226_61860 [Sphaerisporangium flaviroseum]|uniref:Uncharacterized protein n=1 Tax=Sphaerisporangium flaviroseum TaxID=509199 RepID=A0ABP7J1F7_9ACTN